MVLRIALCCLVASAVLLPTAAAAAGGPKDAWNGNYIIVLPDALQRASEHAISVQVQRSNVALRIDSNATESGQFVAGDVSFFPAGTGIVRYRLPFANYESSSVQLFFTAFSCEGGVKKCADSPERRLFEANVTLPVLRDPLMIFTETSKPIYKPGDLVRFRALPLLANSLQPSRFAAGKKDPLAFDVLYVEAPNKMRMAQWKNMTWLEVLRGLSFQLTKDPLYGMWKIVSQIGDVKDEATFTVKEYVLPKFVVSVKPPSYISIADSTLNFKVCAKYSTGRSMKAFIKAKLCVKPEYGHQWNRYPERPCIDSVKILDGSKECAEFEVSTKTLQLWSNKFRYWDSSAFVNATVIENGTDATVTKAEFGGMLETLTFKLVPKIPDNYRLGLPFYGQVQTLNHDGSVRPYEKVNCRVATFFDVDWGFSQDFMSDEKGTISLSIPPFPPQRNSVSIHCRALKQAPPSTSGFGLKMEQPSFYHSVTQVFSPTKTHLQILPLRLNLPQRPCAAGKLSVLLQSNVPLFGKTIEALSIARRNIQAAKSFGPVTEPASKCFDLDSAEMGHFKCVEQADGSYKIRCLPGWRGDNCLTPICEGGCVKGVCRAPNTCICRPGWSGTACNKCEAREGCVNGYCHYGNDCYCKKGYKGILCTKKSEKQPLTRLPVPIDTIEVNKEAKYDPETQLEDLRIFIREVQIPIVPELFPSASIVVWFTHKSENGTEEIVATTVTLEDLRDCLSKATPVTFAFDKKRVRPGEQLTASVKTSGSSVKCALAISDIALETFGGTGGIDVAGLREEMESALDQFPSWPYPEPYSVLEEERCRQDMPRKRRSIMPFEPSMKDSSAFFKEAKTFVLSNIPVVTAPCQSITPTARFFAYDSEPQDSFGFAAASPALKNKGVAKKAKTRVRTFFPESWKFELLEDPKPTLTLKAPDSMTTWKSTMYCATSKGLGISPSDRLVVFQSFFVQLSLPYSLVRNENAEIPVKVFSHRKECSEIVLTMQPSKALRSKGAQQVAACLCNFGDMTAYFRVQPAQLGKVPIEVEATSRPSERCPNPKGSKPVTEVGDAVRRQLLVKPEGLPEEMSFGDLLCPAGGSASTILAVTSPSKTGLTVAEGSLRAYLTWSGNVIGSSLENLDSMVQMPYGCGEQNMASMVPSIYVLDYFSKAGIEKKAVTDKARKFIAIGYQRQLKYRLDDGSFSAFGKHDKIGSTWLTAFVFKSFVAAKKYAEIDSQILTSALSFLLSRVGPNGCFREDGRVFSSSLKGGQGNGKDEVAITAYILGALLEANEADPSLKNATAPGVAAAVRCLNATSPNSTAAMQNVTNYGVSLRAYALTKWSAAGSLTQRFRQQLQKRQTSKDGLMFWKANSDEAKPKYARPWAFYVSADVETTSYALLALLELMDGAGSSMVSVLPILRWLTSQRNERGGWYSTQDTVMALQALTSFARRTSGPGKGTDLSVTLESSEGKREVRVTNDNKLVFSKISIAAPNSVKVTARGKGCLMVQASALFNVIATGRAGAPFSLSTSAFPAGTSCASAVVQICVRYTGPSRQSGMSVVKAHMASGWQVDRKSIEALNEDIMEGGLKLIEVDPDKALVLYFDSFTATKSCLNVTVTRDVVVEGVKPMLVQVYDYYKPHETQESSVQVVAKSCESPQKKNPAVPQCPLCTAANDTAVAAVKRLCASQHYFAAVAKQGGGAWRYTQERRGQILRWSAAAKVPTACKCEIASKAIVAVSERERDLDMDKAVTLGGDWTVVNVGSLSTGGQQKLLASCLQASKSFLFSYNMLRRQETKQPE